MVGQSISHYKLVEKLGEGGMGIVYKAEDTKLNRQVALKFLAQHLLDDEEAKERVPAQAVNATQASKRSAGVSNSSVLRGRLVQPASDPVQVLL